MKRVLHIFARLGRGGLETFVMNLYRSIDRTKIQFDFLLNAEGGDYEQEATSMGARIYRISPRNKGVFSYYKNLKTFFRENKNQWVAVHMHVSSLSSIEPLYFAKKNGISKRIIHAHSSSISSSTKSSYVHRLSHFVGKAAIKKLATIYLGCSDNAIKWLYEGTGINNAIKINNGINTNNYSYNEKTRNKVRNEFNIGNDTVVVGHVGSFIPVKNHKFLILVFNEFHKQNPNSHLMLVGYGPLVDNIKSDINNLGLNDAVTFTGIRKDVNELLQAMDVFVMPSLFEGLPVSLVEAQTSGLVVLASDTISSDIRLTGNIHFLSILSKPSLWAQKISSTLDKYVRKDESLLIKEKGYDISKTAHFLESLYLKEK